MSKAFYELLAALPGIPPEDRARAWSEVIEHATNAMPARLEALDRVLASWPAHARPARREWYAAVDTVEQTGPWDEGGEIFLGLIEPTSPAFALARHLALGFDQGVGPTQIAELARWPWLRTITSVGLSAGYGASGGEAIARFVRAPTTQHLRELALALGGIEAELIASILAGLPEDVERVEIRDVQSERRFAELIAGFIAAHPRLIGLSLLACPLGSEGIELLVERGSLDGLRELTLHGVKLDDEAAQRWAKRRSPGRLRELDLEEQFFDGNHAMRGPGLLALAEAGWFDGLESLALSYHQTTGDAWASMLDHADLSRLRRLRLHCTGFDATAAEHLRAARAKLPALERLELAYSPLSDEAANELVDALTQGGQP